MTYQNHEHFLNRRKEVEAHIHELIALLDLIDEDPDLEPSGDREPELGWTDRGPAALMQFTEHDDREDDGADLEPSLGGAGRLCCVSGEVLYDLEGPEREYDEPSLGWTGYVNQEHIAQHPNEWSVPEGEEDILDLPEGDDECEPNGDEEDGTYAEDDFRYRH